MAKKNKRRQQVKSENFLDSWFFKLGSKLLLTVAVVVIFLTLIQCTVKKPESPSWTTQLTVPVVNRTYPMGELLEKMDQEGVHYDNDSNVVYEISREIDTFALDAADLQTGNLSFAFAEEIGAVDLDPPAVDPVALALEDIPVLAAYVPGVVPPIGFDVDNTLPPITQYSSANISTAQIYAIVRNNLGFDISTLTVELYDLGNSQSLGTQPFPGGIPDGSADSALFVLNDIAISGSLEMRISAGSPGGTVLSSSGKELVSEVKFVDFSVISALAEVPAMTRNFSESVSLAESDPVYRAKLSSGQLQLNLNNYTGLSATLNIILPDVYQNGVPLTIQQAIGPGASNVINRNLAGYEIMPSDSSVPQDIDVEVIAWIPGTAPQKVLINQTDNFAVNAVLSNLAFDSLTGVFADVTTDVTPSSYDIDVPEGFDSLQLVTVVLTLEIDNGVGLPGSLNIDLQGDNGKSLNVSGNIPSGSSDSPVLVQIVDSSAADFLTPVPSEISVSGTVSFGDALNPSTITANDFVAARVNILAPLEVIIPEMTIETDLESEDIDQEDIDAITNHVVEARFIYNVINHLPVGARVNLYFDGDSSNIPGSAQLTIANDIIVVAAPTVAGIVSDTASTGYQSVILDSIDIKVLENDTLYIGSEIILEDSNGQPVRLTNQDYLSIIGRIEVEYLFDGDF